MLEILHFFQDSDSLKLYVENKQNDVISQFPWIGAATMNCQIESNLILRAVINT